MTSYDIVPFVGIHIFIGHISDQPVVMTTSSARTASELDTCAEDRSEPELPLEISALDLKKSRPTQTALGQDMSVEDRCGSARTIPAFETQRYHFVGHIGSTSGSGSNEAGTDGGSILEALHQNIEDSDSESLDEEMYNRAMKEYDEELAAIDQAGDQLPTAHQVLATLTDAGGSGHNVEDGGS